MARHPLGLTDEEQRLGYSTPRDHRSDGYVAAFYHMGKLLGVDTARTGSPAQVWQNEMLPKLLALIRGRDEAYAEGLADARRSAEAELR